MLLAYVSSVTRVLAQVQTLSTPCIQSQGPKEHPGLIIRVHKGARLRLLVFKDYLCTCECSACPSVCPAHVEPREARANVQSPRTGVKAGGEWAACRVAILDLCPQQEQPVCLTTEAVSSPNICLL